MSSETKFGSIKQQQSQVLLAIPNLSNLEYCVEKIICLITYHLFPYVSSWRIKDF